MASSASVLLLAQSLPALVGLVTGINWHCTRVAGCRVHLAPLFGQIRYHYGVQADIHIPIALPDKCVRIRTQLDGAQEPHQTSDYV